MAYAGAAQAPGQLASVAAHRDVLTQNADTHATVDVLLQQCSRDSPLLERLNALTYFASTILGLLIVKLSESDIGPAPIIAFSTLIGMNYAMRQALKRGYARDADLFAELGPDSVPDLIDSFGTRNARIEAVASQVLAQILPVLNQDQIESLSPTSRERLFTWLRDGSSSCTDAKIAIMRALVDVADAEMVGYMEQIIKRPAFVPAQRRMRRETLRILPEVLERLDKQTGVLDSDGYEDASATLDENGVGAQRLLEEEDSETTEESRALLAQIRKHSASRSSPGMRVGYLLANWCFITPYVGFNLWESLSLHQGLAINLAWGVLTAASSQLYRCSLTPTHTRLARQLASTGDTHAIGALAEALEWPDEEIQMVARGALLRLLPKLTTSDASLLNSRQRRCLNNRLVLTSSRNYLDSELQMKILLAWEKVGDLSSLQAVKSLVAAKAVLVNERKVQRAAMQCLPHLEARAHLNESSQMLLRASSMTDTSVETLVRPAAASNTRDEELLRPTDDNQDAL